VTAASVPAVVRFATEHRVRLVIARCKAEEAEAVHRLEDAGFRLMDTLVYSRAITTALRGGERRLACPIRLYEARDRPAVLAVARVLFAEYASHYHADAALDRERVADGYVEWVARSCDSMDPERAPVFVGVNGGEIAGFVTLRLNDVHDGEMVVGGVHPSFAGHGLYQDFLLTGMDWCCARGRSGMVVSTQVVNYTVQRAWARLGMRQYQALYTLHGWFGDRATVG